MRLVHSRHLLAIGLAAFASCAPRIHVEAADDNGPRPIFWQEPAHRADLFYGAGGRELAPTPSTTFTLLKRDDGGYSTTLDLRDSEGQAWSAKLGPESQSEVTASRLVWAMGYPQPPNYYVPRLLVEDRGTRRNEGHARLRPKPDWLDKHGEWSWHHNPFVQTQEYRGLLVLMLVLNNTDLKEGNNALYTAAWHGRLERWYVVKDLGATLGAMAGHHPARGDVDAYERFGFITGVRHGSVTFDYHKRHKELFANLSVDDVRWTCRRLSRLTDGQLADAFRAGGFDERATARFVRKLKAKIAPGLALDGSRVRG
jgi:hypothetical protein